MISAAYLQGLFEGQVGLLESNILNSPILSNKAGFFIIKFLEGFSYSILTYIIPPLLEQASIESSIKLVCVQAAGYWQEFYLRRVPKEYVRRHLLCALKILRNIYRAHLLYALKTYLCISHEAGILSTYLCIYFAVLSCAFVTWLEQVKVYLPACFCHATRGATRQQ